MVAQINAQQLGKHLEQNLHNFYLLCGEEPLQQLESVDAIREAARTKGETERTSFTVSGAHYDWSPITASLNGLSLFSEQQIIEVYIPSGKPGREGGLALQEIAKVIEQLQDMTIIVSLPQSLDRATKNTAWFKAASQNAVTVLCNPVEAHALPQWLAQRMNVAGLRLKAGDEAKQAVTFLAEHVEGNLLAAHQEIQKMALLYAANTDNGEPSEVSFEDVQKAVTNVARYDLFALPQAIFSGQLERSMKMLDGLISEGQAIVRIQWVISNEISSLWRARQLMDEGSPLPLALREARVWGARERMFERVLPHVNSRECLRLIRYAQICDGLAKGLRYPGWPSNSTEALRKLVLEVLDVVGVQNKLGQNVQNGLTSNVRISLRA